MDHLLEGEARRLFDTCHDLDDFDPLPSTKKEDRCIYKHSFGLQNQHASEVINKLMQQSIIFGNPANNHRSGNGIYFEKLIIIVRTKESSM